MRMCSMWKDHHRTHFGVFIIVVVLIISSFFISTTLDNVNNAIPPTRFLCNSKSAQKQRVDTVTDELAEGRWVRGKLRPNRCRHHPPIQCCLENKTRHLVYKFSDNRLNHLNGTREITEKLSDRNISLFGDSLQQQFFEGLAETLTYGKNIEKTEIFDDTNNISSPYWLVPYGKAGGWLQYLRFYEVDTYTNKGVKLWISEETLNKIFNLSEIIIINLGVHYDRATLINFHKSINNIGRLLSAFVKKNPNKIVILRGTTPQHFVTTTDSGLYRDYGAQHDKCTNQSANTKHPTTPLLEYTAHKYGFKFFDTFHILKDRWDLHPRDCTHYCYSKEVFQPQLVLLSLLL